MTLRTDRAGYDGQIGGTVDYSTDKLPDYTKIIIRRPYSQDTEAYQKKQREKARVSDKSFPTDRMIASETSKLRECATHMREEIIRSLEANAHFKEMCAAQGQKSEDWVQITETGSDTWGLIEISVGKSSEFGRKKIYIVLDKSDFEKTGYNEAFVTAYTIRESGKDASVKQTLTQYVTSFNERINKETSHRTNDIGVNFRMPQDLPQLIDSVKQTISAETNWGKWVNG